MAIVAGRGARALARRSAPPGGGSPGADVDVGPARRRARARDDGRDGREPPPGGRVGSTQRAVQSAGAALREPMPKAKPAAPGAKPASTDLSEFKTNF